MLRPWNLVYWPLLVSLYLDDYLTGDDERWHRFKDRARNAVKWRMMLPKVAEQR
jgi:hypothetical protein